MAIHRYGSMKEREENRIPFGIRTTIRRSGQAAASVETIDGCYRVRFTESAVEFIDTRGAGVVSTIERGLVREFEAEAVDCES